MTINKLDIMNNALNLAVAISCPFDADVTSPKAKIVFECNGKTRRLPFIVTNYFRQKQDGYCIVVCAYTFLIDKIFYNFKISGDIKAKIDFYYGENEIESVPFTVSTNIINDNPRLKIDEKYIEYEPLEGVAAFSHENVFEGYKKNGRNSYTFDFDCENRRIIISKAEKSNEKIPFAAKSRVLIPLIRYAFFALRMLLAVLLLPYFAVEGALAALDILPKQEAKPVKGLVRNLIVQTRLSLSSFVKTNVNRSTIIAIIRKPLFILYRIYYKILCKKEIVPNRVTFMSGRRNELSGNSKFVYDLIKDRDDIDFQFLLFSDPAGHNKIRNVKKFLELYASSKIVIVDDYFRLLNLVHKRSEVKLFQLWHACGAFKTFGFARLEKEGGPRQDSPNHRMYDYAIVSSQNIAKHYAESFGLSDECVVATGIPRTDIFMDTEYADSVRSRFYEKYPQLKRKKILLFAPTFRGDGQMSAYYPLNAFHIKDVYEALGDRYAILIKLHPFCRERFKIPEAYRNFIIDLSDEDELNDLLFVTDLLVTDYSSVVFEASLLNIPMLFYVYDLFTYISTRDFYYDFESFVPGKIVFSEKELIDAVNNNDFEQEKVNGFKTKFFDHVDGGSSRRVADLILDNLN